MKLLFGRRINVLASCAILTIGGIATGFGAQSQLSVRAVALTGMDAPGVSGASVVSLGLPFISESGHIVFGAYLSGTGVATDNDQVLYLEIPGFGVTSVFREGSQAPDSSYNFGPAAPYGYFLDPKGRVAFSAQLIGATSSANYGIWQSSLGTVSLVGLGGESAPGTTTTFTNYTGLSLMNGSALDTFLARGARLIDGRHGIWIQGPIGLRKVAVEGESAPGTFQDFDQIALATLDTTGGICLAAILSDNRFGIWIQNPVLAPVILGGQNLPVGSGQFRQFASVSLLEANSQKKVAFIGRVDGSGITSANNQGVWVNRSGSFELAARSGDAAPGVSSAILTNFVQVLINTNDQVAFASQLVGSDYGSATDRALYLNDAGIGTKLVMSTGMQAPGTPPGNVFSYLPDFASGLNSRGEIVFWAVLKGAGVTTENDRGFWYYDGQELRLLIREGDDLEVKPGDWRTISELYPIFSSSNDDGRQSQFNNDGQLVFLANFTDGSRGAFVTSTTPVAAPPKAPENLTAYPVNSMSVRLIWDPVGGETGYRIERAVQPYGSWIQVAVVGIDSNEFVDNSVFGPASYLYRIKAFNDAGDSPNSNLATTVALDTQMILSDDFDPQADAVWSSLEGTTVLDAGQGFPGSNVLWFGVDSTREAITVPVDASSGGFLHFVLRAGNQTVDGSTYWDNAESGENVVLEYNVGDGWTNIETIDLTQPRSKEWKEYVAAIPSAAMTTSALFRWRQLAFTGASQDVWAIDDVTVNGYILPLPSSPAPVYATTIHSTSADVVWTPSEFATAYVLERETNSGTWQVLQTISGQGSPYATDTNLIGETTYNYRVKAINPTGESAYEYATIDTWSQLVDWHYWNYGPVSSFPDMFTPDENGITLAHLFAFNLNSYDPISVHAPGVSTNGLPAMWFDDSKGELSVEFVRRDPATNPKLDYIVQFSDDLVNWKDITAPVSIEPIDWIWQRVRYEDTVGRQNTGSRFTRVKLLFQP